ncbi:hypothetical protein [Spartinivicinus poritis]|uniref:Uncharacterized protein n=1 Tax=Spartinivicinus poritis TaxID=2994640 RepID=A0ABT5U4P2_9GAMM|nr:hypothetical protein [Spartinivicinus sp. A2-2]MDE1461331.1 hypothetical protein [Spartinivicinus sp. A2-2]
MIIIVSSVVNVLFLYFQEANKTVQKGSYDTNNLNVHNVEVELLGLKKQLGQLAVAIKPEQATINSYELILQDINKLSEQINKYHPTVETAINEVSEADSKVSIDSNTDIDPMLLAEQQHLSQPVDGEWASEAIFSIQQAISVGEIEGAYLDNIDCRTNSCKLNLSFEKAGQVEPAIDQIVSRVNWDHQHTLKMSEKGLQIIFSAQSL